MNECDIYDGDLSEFMECSDYSKKLCRSHCRKQDGTLKSYKKLRKAPEEGNFKHKFYQNEKVCFICGTNLEESIEHLYTQSENNEDEFQFRNSCPANFRRACKDCNSSRGNSWEGCSDKKKVHEKLQNYDINNDCGIYYDFEKEDFIYNSENAYSKLYLTEKRMKTFKNLYEEDYRNQFNNFNIGNTCNAFAKIIDNTVEKNRE